MPLPCSSEIFSSSVNCFSTMSARSSGERFLFIQGWFAHFGPKPCPVLRTGTALASVTMRLQNLLFIRMATSTAEFTHQNSSGSGQKRPEKSIFYEADCPGLDGYRYPDHCDDVRPTAADGVCGNVPVRTHRRFARLQLAATAIHDVAFRQIDLPLVRKLLGADMRYSRCTCPW